jgi:tripartite-type tricarboxylate transporter receptor subunit TctC
MKARTPNIRRTTTVALAAIATSLGTLAALWAPPAAAQDYRGPVKLIVGFPPGGGTDVVARLLADKLKDVLGQPVLVENKPGAGGMIATQQLKASPPDGSTMMLTIDHSHVVIPLTFKNPGYDPARDFTPVAGVASYFNALAVAGALNVKSMKEYGDWLKANPEKGNYGVPAVGSVPQFAGQIMGKALNTKMVAVPYKGGAPLVQDVLAGQVPSGIGSLSEFIEHHRAGKLRVLAVSGTERSKIAPEIPTFQELGLKGIDKNPWLAVVGPAGMPAAFVDRFASAVEQVLKMPDVAERLIKIGNEPTFARGPQLAGWISSATAHWGPVIRESGYELQ